jgi:hypothetical protein
VSSIHRPLPPWLGVRRGKDTLSVFSSFRLTH